MTQSTSRKNAGFTLIELIIALAISALIAVIGSAALSAAMDFYQRSQQRGTLREDTRAAQRILRHEWAGRGPQIRSDGSMLEFVTAFPVLSQNTPAQTIGRVRWTCTDTGKQGTTLVRQVWAMPLGQLPGKGDSAKALEESTLATQLQSCSFSFLGKRVDKMGNPETYWVTSWDDKTPAPHLMRFFLSGLRDDMPAVVYEARTKFQ